MCARPLFSLSRKRREAGGRDRRFNLTIERLRLPRLFFILFFLFFFGGNLKWSKYERRRRRRVFSSARKIRLGGKKRKEEEKNSFTVIKCSGKKVFPLFFSFPLLPPLSAPRYMGKRGEKEKKREMWIWGKKKREMAEQHIPYFPLPASRLGKKYIREKRECAFAHCCICHMAGGGGGGCGNSIDVVPISHEL